MSTRLVPEIGAKASSLPPRRTTSRAGISYMLFVMVKSSLFPSLLSVVTTVRCRMSLNGFPAATERITGVLFLLPWVRHPIRASRCGTNLTPHGESHLLGTVALPVCPWVPWVSATLGTSASTPRRPAVLPMSLPDAFGVRGTLASQSKSEVCPLASVFLEDFEKDWH